MAKCPNCNEKISQKLSLEGGICHRCAHVILPLGNDFDLEPSDTQEQQLFVPGVEKTEPEMIPFSDTDEYEATEMIRPLPKRSKGRVADAEYQEDFPDADFIEEEDCIVVEKESVAPPPKNKAIYVVYMLMGLVCVVGAFGFFSQKQQTTTKSSGDIARHDVSYSEGYSEEQEAAQKAKEEEERRAKEEEEKRKKEEKRRAQRARAAAQEEAQNNIDPKIEKALDARTGSLQSCMDYASFANPKFDSEIRYQLTIEADGSVSSSNFSVKGDTTEKFESCIKRALSKWRFPATESRTTIDRTY